MSKLSITFQFDSASEAHAFLAGLMQVPGKAVVDAVATAKPRVRAKSATPVEAPKAAAPVTVLGAPPVHAPVTPVAPAPKQEPVAAVVPVAATVPLRSPAPKAPPADAPTVDAVRVALRTVFNKPGGTGAAAATELLKKFGATSVSTIPTAKYAEFIKACQ